MKFRNPSILSNSAWTIGSYGISLSLRLGANIILSRLLAPEMLGIMVIINSIRLGVELLTDVGIEQNIVNNKLGFDSEFFNTAWTMQIIRGCLLTALFVLASPYIANFYEIDQYLFLAIAFAPLLNSIHSTSIFLLVKNIEVKKRNIFELVCEAFGFIVTVALAFALRSIWALVIGTLISISFRSLLSYSLPHPSHRLTLNKRHVVEIFNFGRWIVISSLVIYAAGNIDKIMLGKAFPLEFLGVYGLARTISDLPAILAGRLSYQIIFPLVAAQKNQESETSDAFLTAARKRFVISSSICLAVGVCFADWAIGLMYDRRYGDAGWMLAILLLGSWFSLFSTLSEALFIGRGRPNYISFSGGLRLAVMCLALPAGIYLFGGVGAIGAIVAAEAARYGLVAVLQKRIGFNFVSQDLLASAIMIGLIIIISGLRFALGMGVAWDRLTI